MIGGWGASAFLEPVRGLIANGEVGAEGDGEVVGGEGVVFGGEGGGEA